MTKTTRRGFLKGAAALGGALVAKLPITVQGSDTETVIGEWDYDADDCPISGTSLYTTTTTLKDRPYHQAVHGAHCDIEIGGVKCYGGFSISIENYNYLWDSPRWIEKKKARQAHDEWFQIAVTHSGLRKLERMHFYNEGPLPFRIETTDCTISGHGTITGMSVDFKGHREAVVTLTMVGDGPLEHVART